MHIYPHPTSLLTFIVSEYLNMNIVKVVSAIVGRNKWSHSSDLSSRSASCPPHKQVVKTTGLCRQPVLRDHTQKEMVLPTTQILVGDWLEYYLFWFWVVLFWFWDGLLMGRAASGLWWKIRLMWSFMFRPDPTQYNTPLLERCKKLTFCFCSLPIN